jgi:hypothetical protein
MGEAVIEADEPPRRVTLSLTISSSESGDGLAVAWESGDRSGLVAGDPRGAARAVAALVLRLAGLGVPGDEEDTRPVRTAIASDDDPAPPGGGPSG